MGRFARLARSVTRSRSVFVQVAQHLPNVKAEQTKQTQISQIAHVSQSKASSSPPPPPPPSFPFLFIYSLFLQLFVFTSYYD